MDDFQSVNRLGAHAGMNLEERKQPNLYETTAVPIWKRSDQGCSILYDPWCTNEKAQIVHGHYHTSWARNIHFSKVEGLFQKPALFDWSDKTIYIVGRGRSFRKNMFWLNKRKNPAIFISSSYCEAERQGYIQDQDYCFIADSRILLPGHSEYIGAVDNPLITFPGIDLDILHDDWPGIYGFVPWSQSPLNNFMRELFPLLPQVLDILCSAVMASHLCCINNAKNVVYVGMDNTIGKDDSHPNKLKAKDINGKDCYTTSGYHEMAMAVSQFTRIAAFHSNTKFFNATNAGVLGVNFFEKNLFPTIKQITAKKAIRMFEHV